jgi:DNA recombination protein RmuC
MEWWFLAAAIVIAGGLIAIAVLFARSPKADPQLGQAMAELTRSQTELAGRLSQIAEGQSNLWKNMEERLDAVRKHMGDSITDQTKKTTDSLTKLQERLAVIDEAQKNITELSTQVVGLQDILSNKQTRGAFGEIQMETIVENALPNSVYEFKPTLSNGSRPDCLIRMPNPPGPIVIDAKFTLESYQALRAAGDEAQKIAAARAFKAAVSHHIKAIAEKYILKDETADGAMMFIPSEAVYAELHANFADVVQQGFSQRVWIVSPTTLMATLNTVRAVLRDARMREQTGLILREVEKMLTDVKRLNDRVENLDKHFGQAQKDVQQIRTSTEKIVRTAERIDEMDLEEVEGDSAPTPLEPPKV